ncbi:MarR family transcriptional regulator [Catenulispora sp. NL8]|uniref:MarR family transcriptional regulator n=1 Tax=Catenulispora pinistramenti TaxID=2705254 RepID=A0ABS5KH75_9ACTN|nr:winged helix-turn-helix transcriptional regulator [Catenulispora pinistramenti]MBS2545325.1 MarR family transcriptional regulator [Catenulispora pinistramenti]
MPSIRKTKAVPQLSASERALLVALVQRPRVSAAGLAGATQLSLATTRQALRRLESLGAVVCVSGTSLDGRSVRSLWFASATVLDLLARSGALPMARALLAPCARDKVLTALALRPKLPIGDIAWATALSRTSVTQMLGALEKQGLAHRVERRGPGGDRVADGWMLTLDAVAIPLFKL